MRVLLINNHCLTDPTVGVAQSLRTMMQWLAEAGHPSEAVTTSRVERAGFDAVAHVRERGGAVERRARRGAVARYRAGSVAVAMLLTAHHDEARPDPAEAAAFVDLAAERLRTFAPDLLIACNAHPMIGDVLALARRRGVVTAFAVRSYGYEDRRFFANVDHVFTCSRFLSAHYRARIGLVSTPLEPPIDWSDIVAPEADRAFVTFVHPAPHKGLYLFARLAAMLGERRPDVPVLVVQSGQGAGTLNALPGLDFGRWPQIMAAPPVARPADYFALTRILLVPSVWEEPFGRVAAEALINGIPPLVSARGALPDVVGGDASAGGAGRVLPVPAWMTYETRVVPEEAEVAPWFQAVCALWDDAGAYAALGGRGRALAATRYGEAPARARHVGYFESLGPGASPFDDAAAPDGPSS